jgi:HK97 gp10 family phage protein
MLVHWDGAEFAALEQNLKSADGRIAATVAKEIHDGGDKIAQTAAKIAPKRSGKMAGSIESTVTVTAGGAEVTAEIGPSRRYFYGRFQEHGTARMSPHPFLGPAVEQELPAITEAILDAAAKAILG